MSETVENSVQISTATVKPEDIHLPPNSYWPIILAFGFSCIMGGLALNIALTIIGVAVTLVAAIGWVIEPVHAEEGHH
ncbi:MAG: cytochrome c oxidase subunit 4 [Anaerolineales bacterium]|nr:cytochrome c oxidase subunit 4 [Anaerolineales bacterium]